MARIMITGATDGIGREAAKRLAEDGHDLVLHGRNPEKLAAVQSELADAPGKVSGAVADLSSFADVDALAADVGANHAPLDALINNAGVLKTTQEETTDGLDVRFMVNTIAPWRLTLALLPVMSRDARVINLSSAAQAPVSLRALAGPPSLEAMEAYAQSKLAITMWTRHLATELGDKGPVVVAVNPGSLLASKMVKEGFGIPGKDIGIGADILVRAATSDDFAHASGAYFDNDTGAFADPHPDAMDREKVTELVGVLERWRPAAG
ncbi:MAG: SDR family NAD(P)-dependent oxidoreductase [Paracoccaceae bacterium]